MTVINNAVRAKIEVDGVKSTEQRIPATVTSAFVVDEEITGEDSEATAIVAVQADIGDTYIIIKQRTDDFNDVENLTGDIAGVGASTGALTITDELYTNVTYGIDNGLWTLETTGNMIASINDSVMKINIDQGGNLATGYQFGFSLANFGLINAIDSDSVFLNNLPTRYYIDFGSGYTQMWAGTVDTISKTGETTADFKCGDAGKSNIEKIGSDLVPIALNKNYNCKLVLEGDKDDNFDYVPMYLGESSGYIIAKTTNENGNSIDIEYSVDIKDLIDADDLKNTIVEVVFGFTSGVGTTYNIVDAENLPSSAGHTLYLDGSVDDLQISDSPVNSGASIIVLKRFNFTYNLSQNPVQKIHTENNSQTYLPLRIEDNGVDNFISPASYDVIGGKQIAIKDILNEDSMLFKTSVDDLSFSESIVGDDTYGSSYFNIDVEYTGNELDSIIELGSKNDSLYYRPISIKIANAIYSDEVGVDPITFDIDDMITEMRVEHTYSNVIGGVTVESAFNSYLIYDNGGDKKIRTLVTNGSLADHYDLEITAPNWASFKSFFEIEEKVTDFFGADSFTHYFTTTLKTLPTAGGPNTYWSSEITTPANYTTSYSYEGEKELSIDQVAIGCNGENVQSGNEFENYPDTIKYIQENYMGIPSVNINDSSYAQAQIDYDLFPSTTDQNPAHQITKQTDSNTILKDMLRSSQLGLFLNREGEYTLRNWLPNSAVFNNSSTIADYTAENWVQNGISKISRSQITQVITDYQLNYDLNEAKGEKQASMRIKRSDLSEFDFDLCTEGVSGFQASQAEDAWDFLRAGYLRSKKENQATFDTNWIKAGFSDGTGGTEAINFIRNQAGHINRELEKVTIKLPLNATDAILDLLSFISVTDQKRTEGETRAGWIVEHKISWKSKEVVFKILLDISPTDPFLVSPDIIQDSAEATDIIEDDPLATDIIQDGI